MQELISKTEALIRKAKKLSAKYQAAEMQILELKKEIQTLKQAVEGEKQKTEALNNQLKIVKLARSIQPGEPGQSADSTELKRKLNEYIREIDSCIAMLND